MKVIGIAGKIASGKTTTAKLFEECIKSSGKKVFRTSLSEILIDILTGNNHYDKSVSIEWENKSIDRENLIEFGKALKKKYHDGILVELAIKKAEHYNADVLVIDGVRTPGEAVFIKDNNGYLIYIDTADTVRFKRLKARGDEKDKNIKTLGDFLKIDYLEEQLYLIKFLQVFADAVIVNNSTLNCLKSSVEDILNDINSDENSKNSDDVIVTKLFIC